MGSFSALVLGISTAPVWGAAIRRPSLAQLISDTMFYDHMTARAIGRVAMHDKSLLANAARLSGEIETLPGNAIADALASAMRADFRNGRIVQLDGWTLAECEAAACIIVYRDSLGRHAY